MILGDCVIARAAISDIEDHQSDLFPGARKVTEEIYNPLYGADWRQLGSVLRQLIEDDAGAME